MGAMMEKRYWVLNHNGTRLVKAPVPFSEAVAEMMKYTTWTGNAARIVEVAS